MTLIQNNNRQHPLSPGLLTEMIFHRFSGEIIDRGTHIIVRTPSNQGFFFGNLALFFEAPKPGSLSKWREIFRKEFHDLPNVKHVTFLWDSPKEGVGDVSELQAAGFKIDFSLVLTARSVHPAPKFNRDITVRPIKTDAEWLEVIEAQIHSKASEYGEASYREFKERQMAQYRAMSERNLGHWFGAFMNGKLVGDLGLFRNGATGRFQSVETSPEFRRQGICGRLVYEAAQFGFQNMGLTELVMVADENYHAAKIYESVGFAPTCKEYSAFWWNKASAD
jgi:ribosomal protein S18 acetylase RimI-like enzyme